MHTLYPTGSLSFVHQRTQTETSQFQAEHTEVESRNCYCLVYHSYSRAVFRCCRVKSPSPSTKRERELDFISFFFFFLSFHFKLGRSRPARTQFQPRRQSESQFKWTLCSFSELIDKTPSHVFIPATECPLWLLWFSGRLWAKCAVAQISMELCNDSRLPYERLFFKGNGQIPYKKNKGPENVFNRTGQSVVETKIAAERLLSSGLFSAVRPRFHPFQSSRLSIDTVHWNIEEAEMMRVTWWTPKHDRLLYFLFYFQSV